MFRIGGPMRIFSQKRREPDFGSRAMSVGAGFILASSVLPHVPGFLGWDPGPAGSNVASDVMSGMMAAGGSTLLVMPIVLFGVYTVHPWRPRLSEQSHNAVLASAGLLLLVTVFLAGKVSLSQRLGLYLGVATAFVVGVRAFFTQKWAHREKIPPSVGTPVSVSMGALFLVVSVAIPVVLTVGPSYQREHVRDVLYNVAVTQNKHFREAGAFGETLDSLCLPQRLDGVQVRLAASRNAWFAQGVVAGTAILCNATGRPPPADTTRAPYPTITCLEQEPAGQTAQLIAIVFGVPATLLVGAWHWATRQRAKHTD